MNELNIQTVVILSVSRLRTNPFDGKKKIKRHDLLQRIVFAKVVFPDVRLFTHSNDETLNTKRNRYSPIARAAPCSTQTVSLSASSVWQGAPHLGARFDIVADGIGHRFTLLRRQRGRFGLGATSSSSRPPNYGRRGTSN